MLTCLLSLRPLKLWLSIWLYTYCARRCFWVTEGSLLATFLDILFSTQVCRFLVAKQYWVLYIYKCTHKICFK